MTCERCGDNHDPYCTHGRDLCHSCAVWCDMCMTEEADALAIVQQRQEEWWAS